MGVSIDKLEAEKILIKSLTSNCDREDDLAKDIITVIFGSHKTYKYVLITGLLAKATNSQADPLALQAGADLEGAYDARSLCHHVVVPFERDYLNNALGGSNEPFLNKPARFTQLSESNAVRRGNDQITLLTIIKIFNSLKSSHDAEIYLNCAIKALGERSEAIAALSDATIKYSPTLNEVYGFIDKLLEKSFEGETSVIVVAAMEKLFHKRLGKGYEVKAHKVNQSGASSNEIGDIDIRNDKDVIYSIEVKDKNFTSYDVSHAFKKMLENGAKKGEFIYGPNATFDRGTIKDKLEEFGKKGFYVLFHSIHQYVRIMLFKLELYKKSEFIEALMEASQDINSKDITKKYIQDVLKQLDWK